MVAAVVCLLGLTVSNAQADGTRLYTLSVISIYVHDDGDAGAACGDMDNSRTITLNSQPVLAPDNGDQWGWLGLGNQHYCSDSLYKMPTYFGKHINFYQGHRSVGETVHLAGRFVEQDEFTDQIVATGATDVVIPGVSKKVDFSFQVEGLSQGGHVRMTVDLELAVS
ncbi:hypothetical protein D1871_06050 [Nakamurella silvestris]|nr:hypothetical protein D1871_06050 [Nakamurella silvestris]